MSEKHITVRLEINDQQTKEELKKLLSSVGGYNVRNGGNPGRCDLLIMEIGNDTDKEFGYVRSLKAAGEINDFFVTSPYTDSSMLINALRAGAREFLKQPLEAEEVRSSLSKFRDEIEAEPSLNREVKKGKVINVIGSKGGVGTTTVAVNLAASLKEIKGADSVALIDMNLLFGEVPLFLDIETPFNWGEISKNISRVDSTYLMSVLAKHSSGLHVLPSPADLNGINFTTPEVIEKLINLMRKEFDYIVIDNGQSLDIISQKTLELSDTVFVVSILSLPCLINVKKLLDTFWRFGYPDEDKVQIIMNRYHKDSILSIDEAEEGMGKKVTRLIPNDYDTTMSAINQGQVVSSISKKAPISKAFKDLAMSLANRETKKKEKRGFLGIKILS